MEEIFCKNKSDLWKWLKMNHKSTKSVWLVYHKPSLKLGNLDKQTIVDYCLCFGWVDSVVGKVDDKKTKIRISARNPKSKWSKVNKENIRRLTKEKKMQPAGLLVVANAKKSGTWDALNEVENLTLPNDLETTLVKCKLKDTWETVSKSTKRMYLETLLNSKKEETRTKNIDKVVVFLRNKTA